MKRLRMIAASMLLTLSACAMAFAGPLALTLHPGAVAAIPLGTTDNGTHLYRIDGGPCLQAREFPVYMAKNDMHRPKFARMRLPVPGGGESAPELVIMIGGVKDDPASHAKVLVVEIWQVLVVEIWQVQAHQACLAVSAEKPLGDPA